LLGSVVAREKIKQIKGKAELGKCRCEVREKRS